MLKVPRYVIAQNVPRISYTLSGMFRLCFSSQIRYYLLLETDVFFYYFKRYVTLFRCHLLEFAHVSWRGKMCVCPGVNLAKTVIVLVFAAMSPSHPTAANVLFWTVFCRTFLLFLAIFCCHFFFPHRISGVEWHWDDSNLSCYHFCFTDRIVVVSL